MANIMATIQILARWIDQERAAGYAVRPSVVVTDHPRVGRVQGHSIGW